MKMFFLENVNKFCAFYYPSQAFTRSFWQDKIKPKQSLIFMF